MSKTRRMRRPKRQDRGSALLVSLMVIVGLSLLGLGFVAISETESAIAKNQQNALQTQAIAEAGAKLVVEWFQDPVWGELTGGLPTNSVCTAGTSPCSPAGSPGTYMKTQRVIPGYTGYWKSQPSTHLCDKPYRGENYDRLYGDENDADLIINRTTNPTAIDTFNTVLLGSDLTAGEVSEIRIYAPPIVGGTLSGGFWINAGQRYGVATIKVTAQQYRLRSGTGATAVRSGVIASHSVRMVVGEVPLPIPGGPIQSNTSISFGGDFVVHWGNETSTGDLTNKRNPTSIPWANAYERPHYEHGFEPGTAISQIIVTTPGSGYVVAPTVTIAGAGGSGATATASLGTGGSVNITLTAKGSGYINTPPAVGGSPSWGPTVTISAPPAGGTQAVALAYIGAEAWPISGASFEDGDFFNEIIDKSYEDPWFGSRAAGDNMADGAGVLGPPQCYPYSYSTAENSATAATYYFQWQKVNKYPWQKVVTFPSIVYDFWKKVTQNARGYKGLNYFRSNGDAADTQYSRFGVGTPNHMAWWANTKGAAALGPGVYFFDSLTNSNPQGLTGAAKTAVLTMKESWNSSDYGSSGGPSFLMEGFYYLNSVAYGSQGMGSKATTVQANFPGEPYRDIGYPRWNPSAADPSGLGTGNWDTSCAGTICVDGAGDSSFSCQDLNGNGKCDVVTMSAPAFNSYDGSSTTPTGHSAGSTWIVKTWKSNAQAKADYGAICTVPAATYDGKSPLATDCSEPMEPYLNLVYPTSSTASCYVGWEPNGSQTYRPKVLSGGAPIDCTTAPEPTPADCTSNMWDADGAVVPIDVILEGVLYNEGDYASEGNAAYYGSLLINGTVYGTGTPDIWFDEKLIKGSWAPPGMPRVMVFSVQTDEQTN